MPGNPKDPLTEHVESTLDMLHDLEQPTQAERIKIDKRRWFGMAILVLGVFCGVVAGVPLPGKGLTDTAMWLLFALALFVLGAWEIDKASRKAAALGEKVRLFVPSPDPEPPNIHRVK